MLRFAFASFCGVLHPYYDSRGSDHPNVREATRTVEFEVAEKIPSSAYEILAPHQFVWLGELHGTAEAPRLFLGLIRLVVQMHGAPVVALEVPHTDQSRIDEFLRDGDDQLLANMPFFASKSKDGRSSQAMVSLLRELRSETIARVVCFDAWESGGGQGREDLMAANLSAAANQYPSSKVVVLSGGIHSRIVEGVPWDPTLRPAAFELNKRGFQVGSFRLRYESGTIWAIMQQGGEGRIHRVNEQVSAIRLNHAISFGSTLEDGHYGVLFTRVVTASPPWTHSSPE